MYQPTSAIHGRSPMQAAYVHLVTASWCCRTWGLVRTLEGLALAQVRAMVDLLPAITVVADDPFNSSPTDPKLMGPDALRRHRAGERLPAAQMPTPLVRSRSPPTPSMLAGSLAFCCQHQARPPAVLLAAVSSAAFFSHSAELGTQTTTTTTKNFRVLD